jgi:hypothetical protein
MGNLPNWQYESNTPGNNLLGLFAAGIIMADIVTHADGFADIADRIALALDNRCIECGYRLNHPLINHADYHEILRSKHRTGHGSRMRMRRNNGVRDIQYQ